MKRIAVVTLLGIFLTTNYAYATITADELILGVEKAQQGDLTQEEAEKLFVRLICSVDLEEVMAGDLSSMESIIIQPDQSTGCIVLLVIATLLTIFYPPLAPLFTGLFTFVCR